ncbi:MAG: MFS transporter permease [Desulfobacterales bacterium]|nr:MFS transporter permease [Desulfobacterales bacterium]
MIEKTKNTSSKRKFYQMNQDANIVVIPREEAVFWLDSEGWWRNDGGRFRKKKIIDYFHSHINRDENGYFVLQDKGGIWEKVYFPYEDTALFAFDIRQENSEIWLVLNTGREIRLDPEMVYIQNDRLYTINNDERIRFAERAMIRMSALMEEDENDRLQICVAGRKHVIKEK